MPSKVSITASEEYNIEALTRDVALHFELLSLDRLLKPGIRVLIKPNLIIRRHPDSAATTHPAVIAAIVRVLKSKGVTDITLADSSGGPHSSTLMKSTYKGSGMTLAAASEGFALNDDMSYREVHNPNGALSKQFSVISPVLDADLIINAAKLKTHCMTGFSGSVKNMFGSVPGLMKPELHCRFPEKAAFGGMLVDLYELVKPQINFIDAIIGMEGNGPTGGSPRGVGALMCSENGYALDFAACHIIGMQPKSVCYLNAAMDRGLCPGSLSELELTGDEISRFVLNDYKMPDSKSSDFAERLPKFMRGIATKLTSPRPVIRNKLCIGCAKCAESCPQHIIEIKNKKAVISYRECIKCFCCHEMCPARAIDIKRLGLFGGKAPNNDSEKKKKIMKK